LLIFLNSSKLSFSQWIHIELNGNETFERLIDSDILGLTKALSNPEVVNAAIDILAWSIWYCNDCLIYSNISLDLSYNEIGDMGASMIAQALMVCSQKTIT
jgi:hypothetical protein